MNIFHTKSIVFRVIFYSYATAIYFLLFEHTFGARLIFKVRGVLLQT